jgi:hypothetical protein
MLVARYAFAGAAWIFVVGILTQAFLAGAGLFKWTRNLELHMGFGYLVAYWTLVLLLLLLPARIDRRTALLTVLLFVLAGILQPILPYAKRDMPVVAALHPVNALVIFVLGIVIARRSLHLLQAARRARRINRLHAHPGQIPT